MNVVCWWFRIWDLEEQVKTLATELRAAKDREVRRAEGRGS